VSRSNGHRSPIRSLGHICELAQALASLLEDAADAGARKSTGIEFVGRSKGFTDADPTGTVALDPTRAQMRAATRRAATLVLRAEDELVEAGAVIANGYLRLDHQEWIRVVEKRSAALAPPIAPEIAPRTRGDGATARHEPH
jgi:hypothetical protein